MITTKWDLWVEMIVLRSYLIKKKKVDNKNWYKNKEVNVVPNYYMIRQNCLQAYFAQKKFILGKSKTITSETATFLKELYKAPQDDYELLPLNTIKIGQDIFGYSEDETRMAIKHLSGGRLKVIRVIPIAKFYKKNRKGYYERCTNDKPNECKRDKNNMHFYHIPDYRYEGYEAKVGKLEYIPETHQIKIGTSYVTINPNKTNAMLMIYSELSITRIPLTRISL